MKCPSAMVDGRMDFLKDELRNDFKEDEQEMGVGTFSLFSNPGSGSTGGGGGGTGTGNNKRKGGSAAAAASKAKTVTETATAAAARNACEDRSSSSEKGHCPKLQSDGRCILQSLDSW